MNEDRRQKKELRLELERQMIEKQSLREKDRLYLDDKRIITSKPLMENLSSQVKLFKKRPADNKHDLDLCKKDDEIVGQEIDRLNMILEHS